MSTTAVTTTAISNRASVRFSTYSGAPSLHPSIAPTMESGSTISQEKPVDSARNTMMSPPAVKFADEKVARSSSTTSSHDARSAEIKEWAAVFERMSDRRLEQQRFTPTPKKTDEISTNALGAKLERALGRRMSGQDAVFKRRQMNEKSVPVAS